MLSKALEMGVFFHRGPVLGNMGDAPFLNPSREGSNYFYISRNFMRNSRNMYKKALETGKSLRRGPRWGTWWGSFTGTFGEKDEGGLWNRSISD